MNRRSFLTDLLVACAAPAIFLPKFEPVRWKVAQPEPGWSFEQYLYQRNPEYEKALFEYAFIMGDGSIRRIDMPIRCNEWDAEGKPISILPWVMVKRLA